MKRPVTLFVALHVAAVAGIFGIAVLAGGALRDAPLPEGLFTPVKPVSVQAGTSGAAMTVAAAGHVGSAWPEARQPGNADLSFRASADLVSPWDGRAEVAHLAPDRPPLISR